MEDFTTIVASWLVVCGIPRLALSKYGRYSIFSGPADMYRKAMLLQIDYKICVGVPTEYLCSLGYADPVFWSELLQHMNNVKGLPSIALKSCIH
jgi:hypothetical protein